MDFDLLAKAPLTGGEIKNAILNSAKSAIYKGAEIVEMEDFATAITNEMNNKTNIE